MAEWKLIAKRERIKYIEERMDYFSRMMKERPRLYGIWRYWWHWYRVSRADWQTRLWHEELRAWKKEIRGWEATGTVEAHSDRAEVIRKNVMAVEDGIVIIRRELSETIKLARARDWHIRYPRPYRTMERWIMTIRSRFRTIRYWIKRIIEELPAKLYRIKIRLYNMERRPTPTGMFQGFYDIDALIHPETGLVNWDWWLTEQEIAIAKYHFVGYFKGMAKWRSPDQVGLAYFDEPTGVPYEEERVKYRYSKRVPDDFIIKAQTLTVGELIIGESSVEPKPNLKPKAENMGVYTERLMIIDADGGIRWDELRNRYLWHPTDAMVKKVKEELGIA